MTEKKNDLMKVKPELLNPSLVKLIEDFKESYLNAIAPSKREHAKQILATFLKLVVQQLQSPYTFEIFHKHITKPFDYYQFGLDFIRPLVDFKTSRIQGLDNLQKIIEQIRNGDNVILLANHQTEPDPQVISLLLEPIDTKFASDMIFVAGHRVTSDPMAVPLSMGRNLLCIYSKKHVDLNPETRPEKIQHNVRTMNKMSELLGEGGHCIYVAPSGGRDRLGADGTLQVAPFDAQSIEMFKLMADQSSHPTHFYPLALKTYALMPPPHSVEKELGEKRHAQFTPVFLDFGDEVDMNHFPGSELIKDKKTKRSRRAEYIWEKVKEAYHTF
jgi:glycerol-3-phosphate O-acyltransferase